MYVPARVIRPHSSSQWLASASLPTRHGTFETHVFRSPAAEGEEEVQLPQEHVALVYGPVRGKTGVPVRVHSECLTSEVFGSLKCDCKAQLDWAMAEVVKRGAGVIVYLRQEGRGIGLGNKIRAYALQAHGHDTVDANRLLGLPDDARRYEVARDILRFFDLGAVELMTNNPAKVEALRTLGVEVTARIPVVVAPTAHSVSYLEAKRVRMSHDLPARPRRAAGGDAE
jgi:GTP cyclohydrolase II